MIWASAKQAKTPWPSVGALWSLLWRAVVFAPFALVFGGIWLVVWPLLIILPFCEIFYLIEDHWLWASITPVVWVLLFLLTHCNWFKADRKDFPNEQENV
jgi:hypothetical protein